MWQSVNRLVTSMWFVVVGWWGLLGVIKCQLPKVFFESFKPLHLNAEANSLTAETETLTSSLLSKGSMLPVSLIFPFSAVPRAP